MQYTIQKKPVNYCSMTSINCVPLEGISRPIFYGFINTGTPQAIIYFFVELEKIHLETYNTKLYNSDLVYLRADFPNMEDILEELAPKYVRGNARYRQTVEIDGVSYYCFKMKRFDCNLTYFRSEFLWSVTDEMVKELYPKFKSLYRAETITANKPKNRLEVLKILSENGIKIVPSAFKPNKDYSSNRDFYIGNIFNISYGIDTSLFRRDEIERRLIDLFNTDDDNADYYIMSVLERIFGITHNEGYSLTKKSFTQSVRTHRKSVNLIRVIELMTISTALENPDIYFNMIQNLIKEENLCKFNKNATEVIDYMYKIAIEDRVRTDSDVKNILNILRGKPIKNIELEKVEVKKIDLKPIEREVINLEEIYKAKIASKQL